MTPATARSTALDAQGQQAAILSDRHDLALAMRLSECFGFHEGICNHFSVRLDTTDERYLINPYGVHWSEIQADTLLMIDGEGTILEGDGELEDTARFIHVAATQGTVPYAYAVCHHNDDARR